MRVVDEPLAAEEDRLPVPSPSDPAVDYSSLVSAERCRGHLARPGTANVRTGTAPPAPVGESAADPVGPPEPGVPELVPLGRPRAPWADSRSLLASATCRQLATPSLAESARTPDSERQVLRRHPSPTVACDRAQGPATPPAVRTRRIDHARLAFGPRT